MFKNNEETNECTLLVDRVTSPAKSSSSNKLKQGQPSWIRNLEQWSIKWSWEEDNH